MRAHHPMLTRLDGDRAAWAAPLALTPAEAGLTRGAYRRHLKRWFDLVAAALLLVLLSPLLLLAAIAVRLDLGSPIIYRQTRVGKDGQPFVIYKFSTMISDRRRHERRWGGPERRRRHKTRDDPRVTRIGRLLRCTSIDELPQLVNVLRGDMSLVGPRPELPNIVQGYAPWQHRRHLVRPGLSGWWQVQGRSERPMHENTELDLYYVANYSFWLDLRILARTVPVLFSRCGAF